MKIFRIVFLVVLFQSCFAKTFQQEPYLKHTVSKGETVFSLAKQFQVTPFDIYRLNPDAKEGLKENTVLLIPTKKTINSVSENSSQPITHKVLAKETLFSLAKQYNVSVADLEEWNPTVKEKGLQEGQEIVVSKKETSNSVLKDVEAVTEVKTTTSTYTHIVQPQETLYGLTRQYNVSEKDLLDANPQLKEGLKVGDTIKIKQILTTTTSEVNGTENTYIVKPQETIYGISKQFSISEEELIRLNPALKDGLKDGMVLILPKAYTSDFKFKPKANLVQSLDLNTKKEVVLLLPFNLSKIAADSTNSKRDYLKKSKLLNVALDFYSGAKIAIDSARKIGLPVAVKIINVESGKNSSNIAEIIRNHNFSNTSAVIGPFMNSHVETTALLLKEQNIPVISPLSKELSKPISNLYNAVPTEDNLISGFINYMNSKNGNIVAIISAKKESSRAKLQKFPEVKFVQPNEKGYYNTEAIKAQLVKGKKNFVILESERASQIMSTVSSLMGLKATYDIQLATLEVNETYNFEEIKMQNLTKLQLLYPSITREPTTMAEKVVIRKLRDENEASPNNYVLKGFDVTFDTLLRVCQPEGFANTTQEFATEGAVNGFHYVIQDGVTINNQIYIQYFDTDYTIKTAE